MRRNGIFYPTPSLWSRCVRAARTACQTMRSAPTPVRMSFRILSFFKSGTDPLKSNPIGYTRVSGETRERTQMALPSISISSITRRWCRGGRARRARSTAGRTFDDIREKLVAGGIPREEVAFIHEANTETRKKELFAKVRSGQVRVLMGSTFKMGAGMNVQDRLVALHDLDCPWRPGDLEQRSGRIIRQGNRNKEVHIYRYVTESTFDAYLWQTVENMPISTHLSMPPPMRRSGSMI